MLQIEKRSEFHQLKEFSTQRWTMTLNFITHKIVLIIKKFDRSLAKNNFLYNSMVLKILFQTNLMVEGVNNLPKKFLRNA